MNRLTSNIRGCVAAISIALNTTLAAIPILFIAILKLIVPVAAWRKICSNLLNKFVEFWVHCNDIWLPAPQNIVWQNMDPEDLNVDQSYLITSNHQSWADIFMVQHLLNGRAPQMKFFLKQELIWVPVIGLCWWALDFPFMKRYKKSYLKKHPEKKGADQQTTIKACRKFRSIPTSVYNFLEGTRFTPEKHKRQQSPYQHLLKPKAGGIGLVLSALDDRINSILDITLFYRDAIPGFWDLLCGRNGNVTIIIEQRKIPTTLLNRDYSADSRFRTELLNWVNGIWQEKDELLEEMAKTTRAESLTAEDPEPINRDGKQKHDADEIDKQ